MSDPYRSLEPQDPKSEIPYCGWCKHVRDRGNGNSLWNCKAAERRSPDGNLYTVRVSDINDQGQCENFEPSLVTRIARLFGKRQPDYTGKLFRIKDPKSVITVGVCPACGECKAFPIKRTMPGHGYTVFLRYRCANCGVESSKLCRQRAQRERIDQ